MWPVATLLSSWSQQLAPVIVKLRPEVTACKQMHPTGGPATREMLDKVKIAPPCLPPIFNAHTGHHRPLCSSVGFHTTAVISS